MSMVRISTRSYNTCVQTLVKLSSHSLVYSAFNGNIVEKIG